MAKKKNNNNDSLLDDMLMDIFDEMLDGMSPDMKDALMNKLNECASEGKDLMDMQNEMYEYQRPDYTKEVQPLAECLLGLHDAVMPSDALAEYARVHDEMGKLSKDEQEQMLRNYLMAVLADGLTRDFKKEEEMSCLPLFVVFQLVDDFKLTGLFDVILETMKQAPDFFQFYYGGYEDVATLILARTGAEHLEDLKEMMHVSGFVVELDIIIFNAVVQMAIENPSCRLQVLAWASDVLKSCVGKSIPPFCMDRFVISLAQIKAVELLPVIKSIYKEHQVPSVEVKGGIKGVTRLLTKGSDDRIVDFVSFKELLEELQKGEGSDFEWHGDTEDFDDGDFFDRCNDDGLDGDARNVRDADALFYKEMKKSRKKKGQRYLYTLDVTLQDSPRKVYRQLTLPADLALNHVGEILVCAVGWEGYHLNQFFKGRNYYTLPDNDGGLEYAEDARQYTIGDLLKRVGAKIKWEYDFGDSWIHEIKLVGKTEAYDNEASAVTLVKATGACPPEDCGGVYGYSHLLDVLKNPDSEEYDEMIDWLGGDFNPRSSNLSLARKRIADYVENYL